MLFLKIFFVWCVVVFFWILFYQKEKPIKLFKQIELLLLIALKKELRNKQGKKKILVRKIPYRW